MSIVFLLIIVFIIGIIAAVLKSPQFIGHQGEKFVNNKFLSKLDPEHYSLINDVMLLNSSNIGTTQIDHIIVSNFGIFCVETKAYAGWIFGRESDKYWTQSVNYHKYRFFNPLRQNYGHVKTLEKLLISLGVSTPIYSFVAFPDAEELKITGTSAVGYARDIVRKIKGYTQSVLSNEDVAKIINIINQANIVDENIRKEHTKKINELRDAPPQVRYKKKYRRRYREDETIFDDNDDFDGDDDFGDYDDDCDDDDF